MPKESYQRKPELNYQITDPCYGREGDKEEEIQTINRNNINNREDRMVMAMEMGGLIEATKVQDIMTKNNLKIMNMKIIRIM